MWVQLFTHWCGLNWKFVLFAGQSTQRCSPSFHESGPILYEGGPAQRMVLKAISNIVLAASWLQEIETQVYDGGLTGILSGRCKNCTQR